MLKLFQCAHSSASDHTVNGTGVVTDVQLMVTPVANVLGRASIFYGNVNLILMGVDNIWKDTLDIQRNQDVGQNIDSNWLTFLQSAQGRGAHVGRVG